MPIKRPNGRQYDLQFPLGGLNRRLSVQSQPPYTTADALNVRPVDTLRSRQRGGSRPGLLKTHYTQLGSGNPIRMLAGVTVVQDDGLTHWTDTFDGPSLGDAWNVASWISDTIPAVLPDNAAGVSFLNDGGAFRDALSDLDVAQAYQIELFLTPWQGSHHGRYQIFFAMDNANPNADNEGVVCELNLPDDSGIYTGSIKRYAASAVAEESIFTSGTTGAPQAGWFRVLVSSTNVKVYWLETLVKDFTVSAMPAGKRFGFGMQCINPAGICLVDTFRIAYKTTNNNQPYRRLVVASSNGSLYKEDYYNTFATVSSSLTLASDRQVHAAERFQKLYIADNGNPRITGTTTGNGINGTTFDSAAVSDWTAYGIDVDDDMVVLTSPETGVTGGTYELSSLIAGAVTLSTSASSTAGDAAFRIERCPKIYDPAANTLTRWVATTGKGSVPLGCPLVVNYRDRIVLAGAPVAPHAWYMSRQGDPLDWSYGASSNDAGRAVAGTNTESGLLGEPIYALIQGGDNFLGFGCENSMWVMRGDPAYGGGIENLSWNIGIVDAKAYCMGPNGEIVFLSRDGLYMMPPGMGTPQPISRDRIPEELLRLDRSIFHIMLAYDVQDRGIHIFLTHRDGSGQYHWWMDWETKGLWPFTPAATSYDPTYCMTLNSTVACDNAVLWGCRDGYVRRTHQRAERDDDDAFTSFVDIGPLQAAPAYADGIVRELSGVVAADSGDVSFALYVGEGHEDAQEKTTAFYSGTWSATGLNYRHRPRARAASWKLRLSNGETGRAWAFERITAIVDQDGRQRK